MESAKRSRPERVEHVAFVTWSGEPELVPDDRLAADACRKRRIAVEAVPWDLPVDWSRYGAIVLRTTWNYHFEAPAFIAWIDDLDAARRPLWNPASVLRWNIDKRYLFDLERSGVSIPETILVAAGSRLRLSDLLARQRWHEAVVKPTVSANAFETWRVTHETAAAMQEAFDRIVTERDILVQRLLPEIYGGEVSLLFFRGEFSHAVDKVPRPGEFRVQEHLGGTSRPCRVNAQTIAACQRALACAPAPTLYARVDGVVAADGFTLIELEAIEPSLFLGHDPAAAERFAAAIAALPSE
jgi:glutathione synthase/RimK-type ligase-like ATP-grasp enzyme